MIARRTFLLLSFTGVLSACGLSRPATEVKTYMIVAKPPETKTSRPLRIQVLPFVAEAQYESKSLVDRFTEVRYESDFYNEYLVAPTLMLPQQIAESLRQSGHEASMDGAPGAYVLTGEVGALYGDFRDANTPRAVMELRLALRSPDSDAPVYVQTYRARVPLADRSAESVVEGLGVALTSILKAFENDLH